VERGGAEGAEEHVGAEPPEGGAVGRGQLEERLEKAVEAAPRSEDLARLLDVEAGPEAVEDGAVRNEGGDGGLGRGLHEEMDLVRRGLAEEGAEEVEDEEARAAVPAVRREGSEVDEDPQASPL
jgi:hypothetical protein